MGLEEILKGVQDGSLSIEEAQTWFKRYPCEDLGFAKLDTHRKYRSGFAEVVFCQSKTVEHLVAIFQKLHSLEGRVLGTRCSQEQYEALARHMPKHLQYDSVSRIVKIEDEPIEKVGFVAVCTAGTADIAVAEECAQCAEFFGANVERIYDVGVSGLHRLLARLEPIQKANCVVAVAGMEGALASVIGGLVSNPVIAVPTSVGYGANFQGLSALLTMLNSCSNGVCTVNIDNGFGAAHLAAQINRLAVDGAH